jgi:hypothetical protein
MLCDKLGSPSKLDERAYACGVPDRGGSLPPFK